MSGCGANVAAPISYAGRKSGDALAENTLLMPAMMTCEPRKMRLTVPGCAKLWLSANTGPAPEPWEARLSCRGCRVGAKSAGRTVRPIDEALDLWRSVCSRCLKPTSRMIGRMHCVSCYNRQREAIAGKNAKGTRPALADQLFTARIDVVHQGTSAVIERPHVTSRVEAIVQISRDAKGPMMFGVPGLEWPGQGVLRLPIYRRRASGSARKNTPPPRPARHSTIHAPGQIVMAFAA